MASEPIGCVFARVENKASAPMVRDQQDNKSVVLS